MSQRRKLRITLDHAPSVEQLRVLRRALPELRDIPISDLSRHLTERPTWVVGTCENEDFGPKREELERAGIRAELVSTEDYTDEYLRSVLPPAPRAWSNAARSLEVVFRPSFSPEVILRAWADHEGSALQLASLGVRVWVEHFDWPEWLLGYPEETLRPTPGAEVAALAAMDLLPVAHDVPPTTSEPGIDGMFVTMTSRFARAIIRRSSWSPSPERDPAFHRVLAALHRAAWDALVTPASRARLEELHSYLGLGLPVEELGGDPRTVRLFGAVTSDDREALRLLLTELSARPAIVDLLDARVAPILCDVFRSAGADAHFVAAEPERTKLLRAGVPSSNVHPTRPLAVARSTP